MNRQIQRRKASENEAKCRRKRTRSKRNDIDYEDDDFKPSNSVKKSPAAAKNKERKMGLRLTTEKTNQLPGSDGMCDEEKVSLEYCPICQFPFKYLVGQNEDWHVSDCLTSRGNTPSQEGECPNGLQCCSISQEHFRRYSHSAQAISRSKVSLSVENETGEIQSKTELEETSTVTKASDQDCRESENKLKSVYPSNMDELDCKTLDKSFGSNSYISDKSMNSSYEKILAEIVDDLETECCSSSNLEDCCKNHNVQQDNAFTVCKKTDNVKDHLNIMEVGIKNSLRTTKSIHASESHSCTASNSKPNRISKNSHDSTQNDDNLLEKSNSVQSSSQGSGSSDSNSVIFINDASDSCSTISKNPDLVSNSSSSTSSKQIEPTANLSSVQNMSSPHDSKKLRQTGIGSYFGAKSTGATRVPTINAILRREPISKSGTKAGKKESGNGGTEGNKSGKRSHGNSAKPKLCPFYKKIPGTSITVDAFSYGTIPDCDAYFLSHFHYDHYGGLKKTFSHNMYCSKVTAALVRMQLKVDSRYITELPMNEEVDITPGVKVILLDANHCPGSVMFLFTLQDGKKMLHTGDFRAIRTMADYTPLQNITLDTLYLDTTYCNPSYNFPTQQSTIDFAVEKAVQAVDRVPKTLIVSGTYSVGKERVFVSIAKALDCKICANTPKKRISSCLEWKELSDRLTTDWSLAKVHVLPMNHINVKGIKSISSRINQNQTDERYLLHMYNHGVEKLWGNHLTKCLATVFKSLESHLSKHRGFQKVVAFKPTGWTFNQRATDLDLIRPTVSGNITIYGVPYSEHSSFSELQWFVQHFKPRKIIPTVNVGSPVKREEMQTIFKEWLSSK